MKFAKICIILLFFIISIGCVSATEEINNNTISSDNTIELDESAFDDARLQRNLPYRPNLKSMVKWLKAKKYHSNSMEKPTKPQPMQKE